MIHTAEALDQNNLSYTNRFLSGTIHHSSNRFERWYYKPKIKVQFLVMKFFTIYVPKQIK